MLQKGELDNCMLQKNQSSHRITNSLIPHLWEIYNSQICRIEEYSDGWQVSKEERITSSSLMKAELQFGKM
jgi:hypothetical protein